jgi:hypothetical protein
MLVTISLTHCFNIGKLSTFILVESEISQLCVSFRQRLSLCIQMK